MPKLFRPALLLGIALFAAALTALALRPGLPPAHADPLFQGAHIDDPTLALFQRACQNCHSSNTQWPWYNRIPPASWMIEKDVNDARHHANFSSWDSYRPEKQAELLTRIGSAVRTGRMPLPRYTLLHREAVLTSLERQRIYEWSRAEKKRLRGAVNTTSLFTVGARSAPSSRTLPVGIE
jgi:Haem-binding domain